MTRDTETGLEWLALKLTRGKSVQDIENGFGGYLHSGFRIADTTEVEQLFQHAGLRPIETPSRDEEKVSAARSFIAKLGATSEVDAALQTAGFAKWGDSRSASYSRASVEVFDTTQDCAVQFGLPSLPGACERTVVHSDSVSGQEEFEESVGVMLVRDTFPVEVDPAGFEGEWNVMYEEPFVKGTRTLLLSPGLHRSQIGTAAQIMFRVDVSGEVFVDPLFDKSSATGGPGTLRFITEPLAIDPGEYTGKWSISRVRDAAPGEDTVRLVGAAPGTKEKFGGVYYFAAGDVGSGVFRVRRFKGGEVSIDNGMSATYDDGKLVFRNTTIRVGVADTRVWWTIRSVVDEPQKEGRTVVHVPGVKYKFQANGGTQIYSVSSNPCCVAPSFFDINGAKFTLTCE